MSMDTSNDELKSEYNLSQLKVRRVGEGRRLMNQIQLDVDVAKVFPNSEAVNEALRTLIRITNQNESEITSK
jgi:hypothetical protein